MPTQIVFITAVLLCLLYILYRLSKRRHERLLATVQVVTIEDVAAELLENSRPIYVYLPPGYEEQTGRQHPVLYLNDGQDREQFKLHETLATLYNRRLIEPIIVVAVPTNEDRLQEYGTAVAPNAQELGKKAGLYGRFLTEELLPLINQQYRTQSGATIAGVSLGGLSAFDIAWNYPELFSAVGVFSGSFWWRSAEDEPNLTPNELIMHQIVRQGEREAKLRIWLEAATRDETADRDNNGVIDAIQDTLELIDALISVGYQNGEDVVYVEVEGGRHNYETWAKLLPDFLRWAFPGGRP
ncbi:MAG: alpha/beta hydrolase-fold protein [Candidatus Promineifilaceae bacterium]